MKLVAMERIAFPNGRLGRGVVVNRLMYVADDYKHSFNSAWACYDRIEFCSDKYFNVSREAESKCRYIRVEYFSSMVDGNGDAYELYVPVNRACEIISNKENFVYKFEVLSREVSDEYMMFA